MNHSLTIKTAASMNDRIFKIPEDEKQEGNFLASFCLHTMRMIYTHRDMIPMDVFTFLSTAIMSVCKNTTVAIKMIIEAKSKSSYS